MKRIAKTAPLVLIFLFTAFMSQDSLAQKRKKYDPAKARETVTLFKKTDPGLNRFFSSAYGYAVFPSIGKGAIGVGGAGGKGLVYRGGKIQGGSKMTQITVGFQFGGQEYSEVIFFEDADAYDRFVNKKYQFAAQASAVALKSGISADAKYTEGVAVFTIAKGGLMYEASVGGQKFKFVPLKDLDL